MSGSRTGETSAGGVLRLVLATANAGKVTEIASIFSAALGDSVALVPRPAAIAEIDETGDTLIDNARMKAAAIAAATGLPAVADDTGLEVDALGGEPGVRSARYAGEAADPAANIEKLLAALAADPAGAGRRARFATVAMIVWPDGHELSAEGSVEGEIATGRRGEGGFGYDPVFVPQGAGGRTFAQLNLEEKNTLSHRGRAFRKLAEQLASSIAGVER